MCLSKPPSPPPVPKPPPPPPEPEEPTFGTPEDDSKVKRRLLRSRLQIPLTGQTKSNGAKSQPRASGLGI